MLQIQKEGYGVNETVVKFTYSILQVSSTLWRKQYIKRCQILNSIFNQYILHLDKRKRKQSCQQSNENRSPKRNVLEFSEHRMMWKNGRDSMKSLSDFLCFS